MFSSLDQGESQPIDESWKTLLSGKSLRRTEYESTKGVIDLLVIPLTQGKDRIGAIVLIHNITELRNRDKALITKDATIKEIHHRVKNNLQTVSALLRLQSRRVEDPAASSALAEAVRRVASIALVHETLSNQSAETVEFDQVFDQIIKNAIELNPRNIEFKKIGNFGVFDSKVAICPPSSGSFLLARTTIHAAFHLIRDLAEQLPQYEFVICQERSLTKNEYHNLLGQAKLVFSANLQETLGISWYEGALVDAIPMVPDRLSYSEMSLPEFKYPSDWTTDFLSYKDNRAKIVAQIVEYMEHYEDFLVSLDKQVAKLKKEFFNGKDLYEAIKNGK